MKTLFTLIFLAISFSINAEILTKAEQSDYSWYLDSVCPDTYCGGDINWTDPEVVCGNSYCSLIIDAASYYAREPFFSVDYFNLVSDDSKKGQGYKLLSAEYFDDYYYDDNNNEVDVINTKVKAWCRLELPANISTMHNDDKEWAVYESALECVDKIEDAINNL